MVIGVAQTSGRSILLEQDIKPAMTPILNAPRVADGLEEKGGIGLKTATIGAGLVGWVERRAS
jgi:hypothetical protein